MDAADLDDIEDAEFDRLVDEMLEISAERRAMADEALQDSVDRDGMYRKQRPQRGERVRRA